MRRASAYGPVHTGFRAVLSLLVAVVALLCVFGHVQRDGSLPRTSAAELVHPSTFLEASSGTSAPCGKKAVADQTPQRAENTSQVSDCSGCPTSRTGAVAFHEPCSGTYSAGPAPPPPPSLHSVLRI